MKIMAYIERDEDFSVKTLSESLLILKKTKISQPTQQPSRYEVKLL